MSIKEFVNRYKDIFYYSVIQTYLSDCDSVLDVGCGPNSPIKLLKKTFYSEGIDIYKQSIAIAKKNKTHDVYKVGNIKNLDNYYKPNSFDSVILLDVIEHLEKKDGIALLETIGKIARKKIIILTPNGFVPRSHHADDNPYQHHRSGWAKKDLEQLGYRVYGLRSFKFIRGEGATITLKPWLLWGFIAFVTEALLYYFPGLSFDLLAIKDLKREKKI